MLPIPARHDQNSHGKRHARSHHKMYPAGKGLSGQIHATSGNVHRHCHLGKLHGQSKTAKREQILELKHSTRPDQNTKGRIGKKGSEGQSKGGTGVRGLGVQGGGPPIPLADQEKEKEGINWQQPEHNHHTGGKSGISDRGHRKALTEEIIATATHVYNIVNIVNTTNNFNVPVRNNATEVKPIMRRPQETTTINGSYAGTPTRTHSLTNYQN